MSTPNQPGSDQKSTSTSGSTPPKPEQPAAPAGAGARSLPLRLRNLRPLVSQAALPPIPRLWPTSRHSLRLGRVHRLLPLPRRHLTRLHRLIRHGVIRRRRGSVVSSSQVRSLLRSRQGHSSLFLSSLECSSANPRPTSPVRLRRDPMFGRGLHLLPGNRRSVRRTSGQQVLDLRRSRRLGRWSRERLLRRSRTTRP